jgi:hypothetical protein
VTKDQSDNGRPSTNPAVGSNPAPAVTGNPMPSFESLRLAELERTLKEAAERIDDGARRIDQALKSRKLSGR